MKLIPILGAAALALAFSSGAFAATSAKPAKVTIAPAARCAALGAQFDAALPAHKTTKGVEGAEKLRAVGGKLCAAKHYSSGERKIVAALKAIGVKAKI